MRLGIITYDYPHLKTEQVIENLILTYPEIEYCVYALPFLPRKERKVFFNHRPNQANAVSPRYLCERKRISYVVCESDTDIENNCDMYMILGAGILSDRAIEGKKILNCHPGIIPLARGLDAFKWSIYNSIPLGITLHYIDSEVDKGEVISVVKTPIYETDTLEILARRHYENEVRVLSLFKVFLENPANEYIHEEIREANRRMPYQKEMELYDKFNEYKKIYI